MKTSIHTPHTLENHLKLPNLIFIHNVPVKYNKDDPLARSCQ